MSDYDNRNSGALFKNDKRETDSHPNAKGSLCVECPSCQAVTDYWTSAWTNTSKAGQRYQSLKITAKEQQAAPPAPAETKDALIDDDIPF